MVGSPCINRHVESLEFHFPFSRTDSRAAPSTESQHTLSSAENQRKYFIGNIAMTAQTLRRISFWIGIAMAVAIPLVPVIYNWMHPSEAPKIEKSVAGLASFSLDILGAMGDGILTLVWMSGFAAGAVVASLIAFAAACYSHESRRTKTLSLLPAMLVTVAVGVLVAIGA